MKKIGIFLVAVLAMVTAGCASLTSPQGMASINQAVTYGLVTTQIANALVNAKTEVANAETAVLSQKSSYTSAQWSQLAYTDQQVNQAVTLIDGLSSGSAGSGSSVLVNLAQLTQVYATTKAAYISARAIIQPTLGKYTPAQQMALQQLDASAQALDKGASALANIAPGTNITPLLISALQVAALAAKVALAAGA
jgi:hypothetical protein